MRQPFWLFSLTNIKPIYWTTLLPSKIFKNIFHRSLFQASSALCCDSSSLISCWSVWYCVIFLWRLGYYLTWDLMIWLFLENWFSFEKRIPSHYPKNYKAFSPILKSWRGLRLVFWNSHQYCLNLNKKARPKKK